MYKCFPQKPFSIDDDQESADVKLGIFLNNNKRLFYKTRLILILKNYQQNKNCFGLV